MPRTLAEMTYKVAREIAPVFEGVATGGSTTTIIDTLRLQNQFADDWFNLGTAWILYDAGGAGALPQGQFGRISDFVKSTGVVTMETVTAVAAGDRYALANARYNLDDLIKAVNQALNMFDYPVEDTTTIDTAAAQTEYSLPTGVLAQDIEVSIKTKTDDANDNRWAVTHNWRIDETGIGTQKLLVFWSQPLYIRDVKIKYWIPHPALYAYDDEMWEGLSEMGIVYQAAANLLRDELNYMNKADKNLMARIDRYDRLANRYAPRVDRQTHKLNTAGVSNMYIDIDRWS